MSSVFYFSILRKNKIKSKFYSQKKKMSANDFLSKTTPAPPPPAPVETPSAVDAWIGVIIFALIFAAALVAAGYFYKHRSEQNEKFVQELRNTLKENLEREVIPRYPDPPYTLKIDPSRMPMTKLPEGAMTNAMLQQKGGKKNLSEARKRGGVMGGGVGVGGGRSKSGSKYR